MNEGRVGPGQVGVEERRSNGYGCGIVAAFVVVESANRGDRLTGVEDGIVLRIPSNTHDGIGSLNIANIAKQVV